MAMGYYAYMHTFLRMLSMAIAYYTYMHTFLRILFFDFYDNTSSSLWILIACAFFADLEHMAHMS